MGYLDSIREQALLNALERGVLGDDTPEPAPIARARDGHDLADVCVACGRAGEGDYCTKCQAADEGERW